jgi:ATP-binding cassette subfamily B protein
MPEHSLPPGPLGGQLRRLAPYLAGQRAAMFGVAVLGALGAAVAAFEPLVLKRLFDTFTTSAVWAPALAPFLALIALLVLREALAGLLERLFWRTRLTLDFTLLQATVDRLHSLPLSYHRDHSVGATMTKIERGVSGAMAAFTELMLQLLPSVVYLCLSVVVMFGIDVRLSFAVLIFAPLPAVVGALASKEQTRREQRLMQAWTRIFARFNEVLSGIVVVKSFVMEEQEKRRFLGDVSAANQQVLRGVSRDANYNALKNGAMTLGRLVALGVGGSLVMKHRISLGTLVAFVAYLSGLFQPVAALTNIYQTLRRAGVGLGALIGILDAHDSLGDAPHAREPGRLRGEVEFRNVSFGYQPGRTVLRDVDLRVQPGSMVALVGSSGAGKSTLMALLQRLYDPSSGAILLDGQDLRDLKQRSVRFQIGVVLQEGTLFSDSIRDNIAFGRPSASQAEIERAARAAHAHEFISALPEGYDTPVGERGAKLSGGERQRIAIARALLKDAPILVLDEATSALDADSEEKVQAALAELTRGRTTFVIAHRLSTVVSADRIVVFKDGTIHETGTHAELLRQRGYYAELVQKQLRGFGDELGRGALDVSERAAPLPGSAELAASSLPVSDPTMHSHTPAA